MRLIQLKELTKTAYDKTAKKYHNYFKNELEQKEYDRIILDKFAGMLPYNASVCDAGCGPSCQYGKYLFEKGFCITGIDISDKCIEMAALNNPKINFSVMDMMKMDFSDNTFDGIISFYSIVYTPKKYIDRMFKEFNRVLRPGGKILVTVKKGESEGIIDDEWYEGNKVYFTYFLEDEIKKFFNNNKFVLDFFDVRKPYDFEINVERIYTFGTKK